MHLLDNAFLKLPFMDQQHSVFGATPSEILHCVRIDPIKECNSLILDEITPKKGNIGQFGS